MDPAESGATDGRSLGAATADGFTNLVRSTAATANPETNFQRDGFRKQLGMDDPYQPLAKPRKLGERCQLPRGRSSEPNVPAVRGLQSGIYLDRATRLERVLFTIWRYRGPRAATTSGTFGVAPAFLVIAEKIRRADVLDEAADADHVLHAVGGDRRAEGCAVGFGGYV